MTAPTNPNPTWCPGCSPTAPLEDRWATGTLLAREQDLARRRTSTSDVGTDMGGGTQHAPQKEGGDTREACRAAARMQTAPIVSRLYHTHVRNCLAELNPVSQLIRTPRVGNAPYTPSIQPVVHHQPQSSYMELRDHRSREEEKFKYIIGGE